MRCCRVEAGAAAGLWPRLLGPDEPLLARRADAAASRRRTRNISACNLRPVCSGCSPAATEWSFGRRSALSGRVVVQRRLRRNWRQRVFDDWQRLWLWRLNAAVTRCTCNPAYSRLMDWCDKVVQLVIIKSWVKHCAVTFCGLIVFWLLADYLTVVLGH